MKKTSYSILFILIAVSSLFSACSKEQIELVTQDLSYQLDPDYISVNIPDTFKFDPANVIYLTGQKNITLHGTNDETTTTIIGGNEIHFTVRIKKEFDNDVTLRLVKDPALMNSYPEDISKYKEILEESFSIPETILESYRTVKRRDHDLESYPQVMAMAAIVGGFRKSTSRQRHELQRRMEPRRISCSGRPAVQTNAVQTSVVRKGAVRAGC